MNVKTLNKQEGIADIKHICKTFIDLFEIEEKKFQEKVADRGILDTIHWNADDLCETEPAARVAQEILQRFEQDGDVIFSRLKHFVEIERRDFCRHRIRIGNSSNQFANAIENARLVAKAKMMFDSGNLFREIETVVNATDALQEA